MTTSTLPHTHGPAFCPACGSPQPSGARFCADCGSRHPSAAHAAAAPVVPRPVGPTHAAAALVAPIPVSPTYDAPAADDPDRVDAQFWLGVVRDLAALLMALGFVAVRIIDPDLSAGMAILAAVPGLIGIVLPYPGRLVGLHRSPTVLRAVRIVLLLPLMGFGIAGAVQSAFGGSDWSRSWALAVGAAALGASSGDRLLGRGRWWWATWSGLLLAVSPLLIVVDAGRYMVGLGAGDPTWAVVVVGTVGSLLTVAVGIGALLGSLRAWAAALTVAVMMAVEGTVSLGRDSSSLGIAAVLLALSFASALPVLQGRHPAGPPVRARTRATTAAFATGAAYVALTSFSSLLVAVLSVRLPGASLGYTLTLLLVVVGALGLAALFRLAPAIAPWAGLAWGVVTILAGVAYAVSNAPMHSMVNTLRGLGAYDWLAADAITLGAMALAAAVLALLSPTPHTSDRSGRLS